MQKLNKFLETNLGLIIFILASLFINILCIYRENIYSSTLITIHTAINLFWIIINLAKNNLLILLQVIALMVSVIMLSIQSRNYTRMAEIASRPHVSIGIKSFRNDSYDDALLNTYIIFKNLSNFTAFVWTKVRLEINKKWKKEYNECLNISGYFSARATWLFDPNTTRAFLVFKPKENDGSQDKNILDYKDEYYKKEEKDTLNITIHTYCSDTRLRKLPSIKKWTELTTFSFRKEGNKWIRNNIGTEFDF